MLTQNSHFKNGYYLLTYQDKVLLRKINKSFMHQTIKRKVNKTHKNEAEKSFEFTQSSEINEEWRDYK